MTPDLQMTRQELFSRKRAPMSYGLEQAVLLLREIEARIPGYRPCELSIINGKLNVTIWKGDRFYQYNLDDSDFGRSMVDIANDIQALHRSVEVQS